MKRLHIGAAGLAVGLAAAAALIAPALAGAHATVSPFQPQSSPLTAARTLYVLRVPNEKPKQPTYKVILHVPAAVQEAISVRQVSDWKVRLTRKDTGKKDEEGNPLYAITAISWTAKRGAQIDPGSSGSSTSASATRQRRSGSASRCSSTTVLRALRRRARRRRAALEREAGHRQLDGSAGRGVPGLVRERGRRAARGVGQWK